MFLQCENKQRNSGVSASLLSPRGRAMQMTWLGLTCPDSARCVPACWRRTFLASVQGGFATADKLYFATHLVARNKLVFPVLRGGREELPNTRSVAAGATRYQSGAGEDKRGVSRCGRRRQLGTENCDLRDFGGELDLTERFPPRQSVQKK